MARRGVDSKILLHVDDMDVEDVIEGQLYVIPPNTAVEFDTYIALLIMEHKKYQGVVEVEVEYTRDGIHWDTETAKNKAEDMLYAEEIFCVEEYVRMQIEDRIRKNYPALPPSGRVERVIKKHNIDLAADYGIVPVGIGNKGGAQDRMQKLEETNQRQAVELAELKAMMRQLLEGQKEAPAPPTPAVRRQVSLSKHDDGA